ncbi:MAG: hypothetical protein HY665_02650 [Chloroflexi bacterium]|nr:hypothetical protein [Chloroflexota bacterium]
MMSDLINWGTDEEFRETEKRELDEFCREICGCGTETLCMSQNPCDVVNACCC